MLLKLAAKPLSLWRAWYLTICGLQLQHANEICESITSWYISYCYSPQMHRCVVSVSSVSTIRWIVALRLWLWQDRCVHVLVWVGACVYNSTYRSSVILTIQIQITFEYLCHAFSCQCTKLFAFCVCCRSLKVDCRLRYSNRSKRSLFRCDIKSRVFYLIFISSWLCCFTIKIMLN